MQYSKGIISRQTSTTSTVLSDAHTNSCSQVKMVTFKKTWTVPEEMKTCTKGMEYRSTTFCTHYKHCSYCWYVELYPLGHRGTDDSPRIYLVRSEDDIPLPIIINYYLYKNKGIKNGLDLLYKRYEQVYEPGDCSGTVLSGITMADLMETKELKFRFQIQIPTELFDPNYLLNLKLNREAETPEILDEIHMEIGYVNQIDTTNALRLLRLTQLDRFPILKNVLLNFLCEHWQVVVKMVEEYTSKGEIGESNILTKFLPEIMQHSSRLNVLH